MNFDDLKTPCLVLDQQKLERNIYAVGIAPAKLPELMQLKARGADIKIILDAPASARKVKGS